MMDLQEIAKRYLEGMQGIKAPNKIVKDLKDTLRESMSSNSSISVPELMKGVQLTHHEGETFDKKAFALAHPELYAQYTKPTSFIKLTVIKLTEEDVVVQEDAA